MEIKIVFEIEEKSRSVINKFSEVLEKIADKNSTVDYILKNAKESANCEIVTRIINNEMSEPRDFEKEYEEQEEKIKEASVIETPVEVPKAATPTYTNEQLTEFCSQASQLGLGSKVKDVIRNEFNVLKVSDLPNEKREDFVNKLRGLGVRI